MKDYMKIFVQIKTKEDEKRWKEFFTKYYPINGRILNDNLVIDYEAYLDGRGYENKSIAITIDSYGYISLRFAHWGNYNEVFDFADFKHTLLYKTIIEIEIIKKKRNKNETI